MHDFVFSTPNTMEIRGRAKEVGISDLGLRISDLKARSQEPGAGIQEEKIRNYGSSPKELVESNGMRL